MNFDGCHINQSSVIKARFLILQLFMSLPPAPQCSVTKAPHRNGGDGISEVPNLTVLMRRPALLCMPCTSGHVRRKAPDFIAVLWY